MLTVKSYGTEDSFMGSECYPHCYVNKPDKKESRERFVTGLGLVFADDKYSNPCRLSALAG